MFSTPTLRWLDAHPLLGRSLLAALAAAGSEADFFASALPECLAALTGRSLGIFQVGGPAMVQRHGVGDSAAPPVDLLADALDQDQPLRRGAWCAAPLARRSADGLALAASFPANPPITAGDTLERGIAACAELLSVLSRGPLERGRCRARVQRLETILTIAGQWNQTLELDELLSRMAEASTKLLDAERASIFWWDRRGKQLIGKPALGVPGGELRIPDHQGVVGQVVQSGQSRRVNEADEGREIDHSVGKKLQYRTRSLMCVPLLGKNQEVLGAFELLNKRRGDFSADDLLALEELASHAAIALVNSRQHESLLRSRQQVASQAAARVQLIGESLPIQQLQQTVNRVAATDLAVLILGENGTGKEVVAQLIHYLSDRRHEPFVAVNCAALPDTLLESELFGHERGAFTDAREARAGKFELAAGGTLLLDEIGDLSLAGQAKLLRVLEEKVVVRVGGSTSIPTDARIIAATNYDLASLVQQKKFRQDLFFRLTVVTLKLPPLRERGDDPLLLAEHFLRLFALKARREPPTLTSAAKKRLLSHTWPGNIRELRNLMERLAYLSSTDTIDAGDLAFAMPSLPAPAIPAEGNLPLTEATRDFQIAYIQQHIDRARGNMTDAATSLGLHRSNLYRKMHQLGMPTTEE